MQEELINAIENLTSFTIDKYTIKLFDNIDDFDKKDDAILMTGKNIMID